MDPNSIGQLGTELVLRCGQVVVVVTHGWHVLCFDHNLRLLWNRSIRVRPCSRPNWPCLVTWDLVPVFVCTPSLPWDSAQLKVTQQAAPLHCGGRLDQ